MTFKSLKIPYTCTNLIHCGRIYDTNELNFILSENSIMNGHNV